VEQAEAADGEGDRAIGADDIKLFIKDEPHKKTKLASQRERIISCLSLEDQVVDRILFWPWVDAEIRNVARVTSKSGWAPLPDGYKALALTFPADQSIAIDKTAWDWTMPAWVVVHYMAVKFLQCMDLDDHYQVLCWNRMLQVVGPGAVFRFPDGERRRQRVVGLMKSGWLLTLSMNSMAQWAQHALASFRVGMTQVPYMWAMGDDNLVRWNPSEEELEAYLSELRQTGCIVKHALRNREFAGFEVENCDVVRPLYKDKHIFALKHLDPRVERETILSYGLIYALSDDPWLDEYLLELGLYPEQMRLWATGQTKLTFVIPDEFLDLSC
jgi:hypothetical protein